MDNLLDNICRVLASRMSRRQAARAITVGVAGAALGSIGVRPAWAVACGQGFGNLQCPTLPRCCKDTQNPPAPFCCPAGRVCCLDAAPGQCCSKQEQCCKKVNGDGFCCNAGLKCCGDDGPGTCCFRLDQCCKKVNGDGFCCNAGLKCCGDDGPGICCSKLDQCCKKVNGDGFCCNAGLKCCGDDGPGTCCFRPDQCCKKVNGDGFCCNAGLKCCGDDGPGACCSKLDQCCKKANGDGFCCNPGLKCCGDAAPGQCCFTLDRCCKKADGTSFCCDVGKRCCGDDHPGLCCPPEHKCCGTVCCPPGQCCKGVGENRRCEACTGGNSPTTLQSCNPEGCCSPPSINVSAFNEGPPPMMSVTVQEGLSGLESITLLTTENVLVNIPAFPPGTTGPVVITATKINPNLPGTFTIEACNTTGCCEVGDPVLTTLQIQPFRHRAVQVFEAIPANEHYLLVQNSTPGLRDLEVVVNGRSAGNVSLRDGELRLLDFGFAMGPDLNQVALVGTGRPGGNALVSILDRVPAMAPRWEPARVRSRANTAWGWTPGEGIIRPG